MSRRPRTIAIAGALALTASTMSMGILVPSAQAEERLPATDFRPCTAPEQFYCVESVTFETDGFPAKVAKWVPTGQPVISDDSTSPVVPTSGTVLSTYPGRWSYDGFPTTLNGYDGIYVQVGPASQASDFAWVRLQPAGARADGTVGRAVASEGSTVSRDLDAATKTTVVIRFGPLEPTANIMVADGKVVRSGAVGSNVVTFSGYPVQVPQATDPAQCDGESGKASALVRQQYAFVVFGNTRQSFGYDGMTGDMSVSTNGTCSITTPTYDPTSGTFSYTASAPHFAPDGTTVNRGFYIASIPMADAALLFGISNPKEVKAVLEVQVFDQGGDPVSAQYSVAARNGVISIAATGFSYSKPIIKIKVKTALWKKKYKKQAEANRKKAGNP